MKKTIVFLTALTLALLLAACGTEPEEDVEKTEGYVSPTNIEAEEAEPAAPPPRINGLGVYKTRVGGLSRMSPGEPYEIISHIDPAGLVFPGAPAADIPVFVNPYPANEGGPMYDVTPELLADMEQRLVSFLELLYGEWDAEKYPFHYNETVNNSYDREENREATYTDIVPWVERDGLRVFAHPASLSVGMENGGEELLPLLPGGDLRQSPLLAAALDYMAIDDPQVEYCVRYNSLDGQPCEYEYFIYQKADDSRQEMLNRLLSPIYIFYFASAEDEDFLSVSFGAAPSPEVSAELPAVSLDQAIEMVQEIFPELEREDIKVRLGYQTRIREKYVLPCWELYVPSGCRSSDGVPLYTPLWVPMVDPAALE